MTKTSNPSIARMHVQGSVLHSDVTLRDLFAAFVLVDEIRSGETCFDAATTAYKYADAMLKAREEQG